MVKGRETSSTNRDETADVLIIGAGFSGMIMAIECARAGLGECLLIEKGDDIGGTWRDNTYPGAACDIPSHLYSIASEPSAMWTRMYAGFAEIQRYLQKVARKHGLYEKARFNQRMERAYWDAEANLWIIETSSGATFRGRYLVSCVGALHLPKIPGIEGQQDFEGVSWHSAEWNHDYDLAGKRVAVIGTGASAIQFVPQIAPEVGALHLFQRTPPWIIEKQDPELPAAMRLLFERVPSTREAFRQWIFWRHEIQHIVFRGFEPAVRIGERKARKHLMASVKDPLLREQLTPDYRIGCKRVLRSNDYYPALARENVSLHTSSIVRIERDAVITADNKRHEVDAIIYGTGFHTTTAFDHLNVTGKDEQTLQEAWSQGMEAHLGTSVHGFPNFFMLLGPNTGLGHNSVVLMIEAQVGHIIDLMREVRHRGAAHIEPSSIAQQQWVDEVQGRLSESVWQEGGCSSWYQDANGKNTTLWPGTVAEYQARMKKVGANGYNVA